MPLQPIAADAVSFGRSGSANKNILLIFLELPQFS